jgi:uncharacterized protein YaiI (UPF0178 family)
MAASGHAATGDAGEERAKPVALNIYVDGDGCPVKEDIYRVAQRYGLHVFLVCNSPQRVPKASWLEPIVVGTQFDAVDDWIAERIERDDIAITNDLLLAERCLKKQARVIDPRGRELTEDNIGDALANRELMYHLRQMGNLETGPKPRNPKHRSQFLSRLDEVIQAVRRATRQ